MSKSTSTKQKSRHTEKSRKTIKGSHSSLYFYLAGIGISAMFIIPAATIQTFLILDTSVIQEGKIQWGIFLVPIIVITIAGLLTGRIRLLSDLLEKSSEQQQRELLNNTSSVVYMKDMEGRYQFINRRFEKLFHISEQEVKGKTDYDLFPKDKAETFRRNDLMAIEADKPLEFDEIVTHDGVEHTYISVKFPLKNASGKNYASCGISTDITERINMEAALRENALRLTQLFEHTDAISVQGYDRNRKVFYWNEASEKLYGYSADAAIGQRIEDLIIPDGIREQAITRVTVWFDGGPEIPSSERELRRADGQPVQVFCDHVMLHNQENEPEMYCIDIDLTKMKQTEQAFRETEDKYQALYDNAPLSYQSLDKEGCLLDVNPAWLRTLGYDREEVIGKWLGIFLQPDAQAGFNKHYQVFKRRGYMHGAEFKIRHKQGHYLDVSLEGLVGYSADGSFKQTYCVFMDITQRKRTEEDKKRLQHELDQAHKMEALGQLTGGIAHDFNNILGVIMGNTSLALNRFSGEVPEKLVSYLETSLKASERARDLVAQMLLFSRSSERDDDRQVLQLEPLVNETVKMLYSALPSTIKIKFSCEDDVAKIRMNPAKLQQMLMNLCVNARDAMDSAGTINIRLGRHQNVGSVCSLCHQQVKGDWIELMVSDTGSGMSLDTLEHIFEPFFTTKEVGQGTGMGMSVLHGIITAHGGHVLVKTEVGKGSSFCLLFPPVTDETPHVSTIEQIQDDIPHGEGRHVLVVDDESDLAEYVGSLLEVYGYKVSVETESSKALELFKDNPGMFSLLVTDQTMPGLTGAELVRQIREIRADFPVVICSGYGEKNDDAEAAAISYLKKPFDMEQLAKKAAVVLGLAKT